MLAKLKKLSRKNYRQISFVFLAFLIMVLVSYFYVSDIVRKQLFAIGEETMNTTQMAVSSSLSETKLIFANTMQTVEKMLYTDKTNQEILEFLIETNGYFKAEQSSLPDFMKVYGYIRGEFLDGSGWVPPSDYDPTKRPWYISAHQNGGGIVFSEPYIDAETGGMCISFSQNVLDQNGDSYGVVAIDLKLTRITDYVSSQQIANNGYGVLVSDTLNFTSHRDSSLLGVSMFESGGGYGRIAQMIQDGEPIAAERFTDSDGTDSIAFFRTIFNGWHIGVIIPWASYYKQVYILGITLSILGFVLMSILSYILIRTHAEKLHSDEESKSKSEFLSRMSHEMRTPMNAIIGMTRIAQSSDDIQRVQYCLGKINDASNHLLGVINDVLDISKIEAGKLELSETNFRFEDMIQQVITVINYKIEEKHQKFTIIVDENVPLAIVSDKQRLAQVIANLLSNANKFTPEGGNISMLVHCLEEADGFCTLQIDVCDDGIGISEEQQSRLFLSFEQADGGVSRKYGGTGLGLAISKKIIEMMNGKIWVESELEKGSQFKCIIRAGVGSIDETTVQNSASVTMQKESDEYTQIFIGKRILLAEDVEINREILMALLDDTGVKIDCAEDGRQAVDMFAANPNAYDMIFMDVHMPEVDGYEATRCIRAMNFPWAKTIPILAMTANVFREDIDKCLASGMNDHVGKPLELDEVLKKMKQHFHSYNTI